MPTETKTKVQLDEEIDDLLRGAGQNSDKTLEVLAPDLEESRKILTRAVLSLARWRDEQIRNIKVSRLSGVDKLKAAKGVEMELIAAILAVFTPTLLDMEGIFNIALGKCDLEDAEVGEMLKTAVSSIVGTCDRRIQKAGVPHRFHFCVHSFREGRGNG